MRPRSRSESASYWPGFVDALTTLLLVIIFLLVVFVLAQVVLSSAITGKDEALDRLNRQVAELADLLALERQDNANLRLDVAQLSSSLQSAVSERDELVLSLQRMTDRAGELERRAEAAETALAEAEATVTANKETLELRLREMASLRRDIAALRELRSELESRIGQLSGSLEESRTEAGSLRDRTKELEVQLADAEERTLLAQKEIADRDVRLSELLDLYQRLDEDYAAEQKLSGEQRAQIGRLNQQILALRQDLQKLNAALDAAELKDQESEAVIADLGRRLNRALAGKVEELSRYRSEFFGRLREVLGSRRDIQIVGDRFVFQSEVLFDSGSAELEPEGRAQLAQLAETLLEISGRIPAEINWILRVDGHTDSRPIATARFPSNWELSAARAISVTKFLIDQGVPSERLAATGFAAFQPLDDRFDEIAYRRNRRIELKLTQR